jgi:hypothetical protein
VFGEMFEQTPGSQAGGVGHGGGGQCIAGTQITAAS